MSYKKDSIDRKCSEHQLSIHFTNSECEVTGDFQNNVMNLSDFREMKEIEKEEKKRKSLIDKAIQHSKTLDW